jgi:hypothetical protein
MSTTAGGNGARSASGHFNRDLQRRIQMFALKVVVVVFGAGVLLSAFSTFGTDEACVLLAALFG